MIRAFASRGKALTSLFSVSFAPRAPVIQSSFLLTAGFRALSTESDAMDAVASKLRFMDVSDEMDLDARIQWLTTMFNELDADNDGVISVADLALLPPTVADLVRDVSTLFDRSGDGKIDLHEFAYGVTFCVQIASPTPHTRKYYDSMMFALMDEDSNGVLDKAEIQSWLRAAEVLCLLKPEYTQARSGEDLAETIFNDFGALSAGSSAEISFEEFAALSYKIIDYSVFEKYTVKDLE